MKRQRGERQTSLVNLGFVKRSKDAEISHDQVDCYSDNSSDDSGSELSNPGPSIVTGSTSNFTDDTCNDDLDDDSLRTQGWLTGTYSVYRKCD